MHSLVTILKKIRKRKKSTIKTEKDKKQKGRASSKRKQVRRKVKSCGGLLRDTGQSRHLGAFGRAEAACGPETKHRKHGCLAPTSLGVTSEGAA